MELELQKDHYEYCLQLPAMSMMREESTETIVPDYSPDIARIVDVSASFFLLQQSISDTHLSASGTVKLSLLYMAEGVRGLRSMEYAMPCEYAATLPEDCSAASVEGIVCRVQARTLNPRKLFTQVEIEWKVVPYRNSSFDICGQIPGQEEYAIETRSEEHEISLIRAAESREFTFSDDLTLPGGKAGIAELLRASATPHVTECKSLGSKVILKGVVCVTLLYNADGGELCAYAEELPFSQILDGYNGGDSLSVSTILSVSGCEIHTDGSGLSDGARTVSVRLLLNAFMVLRESINICCITDLYSTSCELDGQIVPLSFRKTPSVRLVQQTAKEQIDTGAEARRVLYADVAFGSAGIRKADDRAVLFASAVLKVLYLDDAGVPFSAERKVELSAETDLEQGAQIEIERVCEGDITANANGNSIELRFPVEFILSASEPVHCSCLTSLDAEFPEAVSQSKPSLVLRALNEGERLWDIAKNYRTTVDEILTANELNGAESVRIGQMLLIPRKRV